MGVFKEWLSYFRYLIASNQELKKWLVTCPDPFVFIQHRAIFGSDQIQRQAVIENIVETLISIRSSSSFAEDLPELAEPHSTSQGGKIIQDKQENLISADEIAPIASAVSTRGFQDMITKSQTWDRKLHLISWKREKACTKRKVRFKNESKKAPSAERNSLKDSWQVLRYVNHKLFFILKSS